MKITCPNCGFSRDVPEDRIPKSRPVATCPQCKCRFPVEFRQNPHPEPAAQPKIEEEDMRPIAAQAYQREAERFAESAEPEERAIPWEEAPVQIPWLAAFIQTVMRVMFSAQQFFRLILPDAPLLRPLGFFILVSAFETLVERGWLAVTYSVLSSAAQGDPGLEQMLRVLQPTQDILLSTLIRCAWLVIQLYISAAILTWVFRLIVPGRSRFSLLFQVLAYSSAPSILCIVPLLGSVAGNVWSLACLLIGCKTVLGLDWSQTILGFAPIALISICLTYGFLTQFAALPI